MSDAVVFDSHAFVKRLTAAGFTERQAETLAAERVRLLEANLAIKAEIAAAKAAPASGSAALKPGSKRAGPTCRDP